MRVEYAAHAGAKQAFGAFFRSTFTGFNILIGGIVLK